MQLHVEQVPLLTYDENGPRVQETTLICEATVTVRVNGAPATRVQCMPDELGELAVGLLVTAGVLQERSELRGIEVDRNSQVVDIAASLPPGRLERTVGATRTATDIGRRDTLQGACGTEASSKHVHGSHPGLCLPAARVMELGHEFDHRPGLYQQTQCVHSAALTDGDETLYFAEDLGRHSAVDKVIGRAFIEGRRLSDLALLCSGRFAYDMVTKVAQVRIPLVISPAAATREAAMLAEHCDLTLCGRVRQHSMTVYSAPWRVA